LILAGSWDREHEADEAADEGEGSRDQDSATKDW
jgi:hypothetical protein